MAQSEEKFPRTAQAEEKLRAGVRSILLTKYNSVVGSQIPDWKSQDSDKKLIQQFEEAIYNTAVVNWREAGRKQEFKSEYASLYKAAETALADSPGPFPDRILAVRLLRGGISPEDATSNEILMEHNRRTPRDTAKKLFVGSLLRDSRLKDERTKALDLATRIEASCYRAVIAASKSAEDPYRRHWGSESFKALYSGRCGTVNSHLDPDGSVCREYGSELLTKILTGTVPPDSVGDMTAVQMCPEATRVEKLEIELRSQQHVQEKWSDLFVCPECRRRQCTYIEKQKRSLDEPAAILCKCICGRKFVA
jgi:DNA-directed RNA polymerase subunit M/transcription elongation factor TFIIS